VISRLCPQRTTTAFPATTWQAVVVLYGVSAPARQAHVFLVDGMALIYRAFYAMISRPLPPSRGENTSAAWGVVNFLAD